MEALTLTKLVSEMRQRRMTYARISEELKSHGVNMAPGNLWRWYQRQLRIMRQLELERRLIEGTQPEGRKNNRRNTERHKPTTDSSAFNFTDEELDDVGSRRFN